MKDVVLHTGFRSDYPMSVKPFVALNISKSICQSFDPLDFASTIVYTMQLQYIPTVTMKFTYRSQFDEVDSG